MKLSFNDGSFICLDESPNDGIILTISMCGLSKDGNKLTMSSSELDLTQTHEISEFLQEILKKFV